MAQDSLIIEMAPWLKAPAGRYLLAWEQRQLDRVVADIFGYHAVQVGWPMVQALRASRISHPWMLNDGQIDADLLFTPALLEDADTGLRGGDGALPVSVLTDYDALPFPSNSLDLVVLPHTLEMTADAHHTLREVERVLMPEGRVVIVGFNPTSLWGLCHQLDTIGRRVGMTSPVMSETGEFIGPRRLRDWLRLLGFEIESGQFGCYRPPFASQGWLDRSAWWDHAGERWWPVLGSVYMLVAVKRVRAMRLLGPEWKRKRRTSAAPAVVAQRQPHAPSGPSRNSTD
ncbi:class I SAM-dependent methyltransferase [Sphaerotilus montanus]|uniref:class I SAM-dependent methyltransferase n=1 Tax=Sphaerotilus montanus TaxID=522889 RepID=UPI003FA28FE7